jgi:hypothetical protein
MIKEQKSLKFLQWFGTVSRRESDLPSWVPDFTITDPIGVLPRTTYATNTHSSNYLYKISSVQFRGDEMILQGKCIDYIVAVVPSSI